MNSSYPAAQASTLLEQARRHIETGKSSDAVSLVRSAVDLGISHAADFVKAGFILSHSNLPGEALPLMQRAVQLSPDMPDALYGLGSVKEYLGDISGAQTAFETAIKATRDHFPAASYRLAHLKTWTSSDNHIRQLESLQCKNAQEAARVGFSLFKEYDDLGDVEAAWDCLEHGAKIAHHIEGWRYADERANVDAWCKYFTAERFKMPDTRPRSGPRRIFIVGLPRSGTTLVERILTAHSRVQSIGELKTFGIATHQLTGVTSNRLVSEDVIAAAARLDPLDIANLYTRESAYLNDGSAYTIDKRPHNLEYAGLIKLAFPDAVIIALNRNPMDSLFGAFKLLFTGAHGWSYDQTDLADHFHNFRTLCAHWKSVLKKDFVEVSLEAIIKDPDTQIRDLLSACGLEFEAQCLRPHEAKGAVTTASASQVRRPINSSGVSAWRRYETYLAPLRHRLIQYGYLTD